MRHIVSTNFILLMFLNSQSIFAQEPIQVDSTLLKIIEIIQIPAQQSGVLQDVSVKEGTIVDRGEVIAKIESREMELEREKAMADFAIAQREAKNDINIRYSQKTLQVSETELQRALDANAEVDNSVSATEVDRLRLVVEENRLAIEQAQEKTKVAELTAKLREAELKIVEEKLRKHQIISPLEGMVVQRFRRSGEWVEQAESLVEIVRIDRLRAEGFVSNEDALLGLEGKSVQVEIEVTGQAPLQATGTIVFVDPVVDPVNRQVRIWAEIENKDLKLRPGLRANMRILVE